MRQQFNPFLMGLVWLSFALHLWGIRGNLPYAAEIDEPVFVTRAIRMAATSDLNPRWFGHPGSTLIYPLVGLYHLGRGLTSPGIFLRPAPTLQATFKVRPSEFYMFGRYLTIGCLARRAASDPTNGSGLSEEKGSFQSPQEKRPWNMGEHHPKYSPLLTVGQVCTRKLLRFTRMKPLG